jgi:hypothetical protein
MPLTKKNTVKICFNKTTFHPALTMSYERPRTSDLLIVGLEAANPPKFRLLNAGFLFCADLYKNIFYSQKIRIYVLCERISSPVVAVSLKILQWSRQEPEYCANVHKATKVRTKTLWVGEHVTVQPVSIPVLSQKLVCHFWWLCICYNNNMVTLESSVFM